MGCGKSKLDGIANGNIMSRKKSSVNGTQEMAVKEETTIPANGVIKEERESHDLANSNGDEKPTGDNNNNVGLVVAEETKEEKENINDKKQGGEDVVEGEKVIEEEKELVAVVEGEGTLVSKESPEKYFSSRHQREDSVDNKSEYLSPRINSSKESPFHDDHDHQEVNLNHVDANGSDNGGASLDDDHHPADGTVTTDATTTTTVMDEPVENKEEFPTTSDEPDVVSSSTVVPVDGKDQDVAAN